MFGLKQAKQSSEKCQRCKKPIGLTTKPDEIEPPRPVPVCGPCYSKALHSGPEVFERFVVEFEAAFRSYLKAQANRPTLSEAIIDGNEVANEVHAIQTRVFELIAQGKPDEAKALNAEVQRRMNEVLRFRKEAPVHLALLDGSAGKEGGGVHE